MTDQTIEVLMKFSYYTSISNIFLPYFENVKNHCFNIFSVIYIHLISYCTPLGILIRHFPYFLHILHSIYNVKCFDLHHLQQNMRNNIMCSEKIFQVTTKTNRHRIMFSVYKMNVYFCFFNINENCRYVFTLIKNFSDLSNYYFLINAT